MKLPRIHPKRGRVEVIPLIDTVLILLIFYMSFSSFTKTEKNFTQKLPSAGTGIIDLVLHVRDGNHIFCGDNVFTVDTLKAALRAGGNPRLAVVIEAEPQTRYQDVIGTLDACASASLTKVTFRPLGPSS